MDPEFLSTVGGRELKPYHIPLDIFYIEGDRTPPKKMQAANGFVDVLDKIYGGIGPVQKNNLKTCILELLNIHDSPLKIKNVYDAYLEKAGGQDAVSAILNGFILSETFSNDVNELKPIQDLLKDEVLVLNLGELQSADERNALATIFLNK